MGLAEPSQELFLGGVVDGNARLLPRGHYSEEPQIISKMVKQPLGQIRRAVERTGSQSHVPVPGAMGTKPFHDSAIRRHRSRFGRKTKCIERIQILALRNP